MSLCLTCLCPKPSHAHALHACRYYMHVGCQWTGITLFVPAFVIAFVQFPTPIIGANIGQVHKILGILVMALVVLQVVVCQAA